MSDAAATARADRLIEWRSEFPTVESTLYFVSHSLGAMPRVFQVSA